MKVEQGILYGQSNVARVLNEIFTHDFGFGKNREIMKLQKEVKNVREEISSQREKIINSHKKQIEPAERVAERVTKYIQKNVEKIEDLDTKKLTEEIMELKSPAIVCEKEEKVLEKFKKLAEEEIELKSNLPIKISSDKVEDSGLSFTSNDMILLEGFVEFK